MLTTVQSAAAITLLVLVAAAAASVYATRDPPMPARRRRLLLMRRTMGAVLVLLALFKLARLQAFARAFRLYDPIASALPLYGFAYPFLELGLGVAWWRVRSPPGLSRVYGATIVLMGVSLAGALHALNQRTPPECGCLGTVLRMPVSHVTLAETGGALAMALYLLVQQRRRRVRFRLPPAA